MFNTIILFAIVSIKLYYFPVNGVADNEAFLSLGQVSILCCISSYKSNNIASDSIHVTETGKQCSFVWIFILIFVEPAS